MDPTCLNEELFLEAARPDLLRVNAFRVTELSVEASEQEISRQAEKLRMMESYGGGNRKSKGPLQIVPSPDTDEIRQALQRLRDPAHRLLDELFWFWSWIPTGQTDEASALLNENKISEVVQLWYRVEQEGQFKTLAIHNLAVLFLTTALEWEFGTTVFNAKLNAQQQSHRDCAWRQAFNYWRRLCQSPGFWSRLTHRVQTLKDARLKSETAEELRQGIPMILMGIIAQLAVHAAERKRLTEAGRLIELMECSGFDSEVTGKALRWAIEPTRNRIETLTKDIASKIEANPLLALQEANQLFKLTKPLLNVVDAVLETNQGLRDGIHDEVALSLLSCLIGFGNKTENWPKVLPALEKVLELAGTDSARDRIHENLRIAKENTEEGSDWCAPGYWELSEHLINKLEQARERSKAREWEATISMLEDLLVLPEFEEDAFLVEKPIAFCLNMLAVEKVNQAAGALDQPVPMLSRIADNSHQVVLNRLYLQSGSGLGLFSDLRCSNPDCGTRITGQYIQYTFNGVEIVLCTYCGNKIQQQQEEKRSKFSQVIKEALEDLYRASSMDPDNKTIAKNVDEIGKMASELGVKVSKNRGKTDCFIATAAYGTPFSQEVQWLREYRDRVLLQSSLGRRFVQVYYLCSPPIASLLSRTKIGRSVVRWMLTPVVAWCRRRLQRSLPEKIPKVRG